MAPFRAFTIVKYATELPLLGQIHRHTQTLGIKGWQRSRGNLWMLKRKFHKSRGMPTDTTVVSSTSKPYSHVQESRSCVIPGQCNSDVVADGRGWGWLPGAWKPGWSPKGGDPMKLTWTLLGVLLAAGIVGVHRVDAVWMRILEQFISGTACCKTPK
jgi:hypothetical protein